jgi:uncharacterized membrane protein YkvA (DUF1232 family)
MSDDYWYPTRGRVEEINRELTRLEGLARAQIGSINDHLELISSTLKRAYRLPGFPKNQTRQWLWIASQFRGYSTDNPKVATIAGAAVNYLGRTADSETAIDHPTVQDLNWVVGKTIEALVGLLDSAAIRANLRPREIQKIELRLRELAEASAPDAEELRIRITSQLEDLRVFAVGAQFTTLEDKINALFEALSGSSIERSKTAKAALLYLADPNDIIPDSSGVLGLLDDIYVIDAAYASVEKQTTWLPILERMLEKWPFVGDLSFADDDGASTLDRFGQYVTCATLQALFESSRNNILLLRETGPFALVAALATGLQILRSGGGEDFGPQETGQSIFIGDDVVRYKARYRGPLMLEGKRKHWIEVGNAGRFTIDDELMSHVTPSPREHNSLSPGADVLAWIRARHPDPLGHLAATARRFTGARAGILLLSTKKKIDEFLPLLHPFGADIPSLLGMRYVTATGKAVELKGSETDLPMIFACSDAGTALELYKNRPAHLSDWRVIADGAALGRTFWSAVKTSGLPADFGICVLAETCDREAAQDLIRKDFQPWYLDLRDVEVPSKHVRLNPEGSKFGRFLRRQRDKWASMRDVSHVHNDFVELVAEVARDLSRNEQDENAALEPLSFMISSFLHRIIGYPTVPPEDVMAGLDASAKTIINQASLLRQFDSVAANAYTAFKELESCVDVISVRETKIRDLISRSKGVVSGRSAVLCRSASIVSAARRAAKGDPVLSSADWMTIEELRQKAPISHLIVPGWIDKFITRELVECSYAAWIEYALYPFEERWLSSCIEGSARWINRLAGFNSAVYGRMRASDPALPKIAHYEAPDLPITGLIVQDQSAEQDGDDASDPDEINFVESRIVDLIRRQISANAGRSALVKARLILFEDVGAYAYLFPHGKVILLSDLEPSSLSDKDAKEVSGGGRAEKMLLRSVESLVPGALLAFSVGGGRDLIDAKADQFLKSPTQARRLASLWKDAIRRYVASSDERISHLSELMRAEGEPRDPNTIRLWTTYSQTIAPRNYSHVIPILARLTGDPELERNVTAVISAVDSIYRAHDRAAIAIVGEIFSGDIDLTVSELTFEMGDSVLRYELHRVKSIGDLVQVPLDVVGDVRRVEDEFTISVAAE